MPTPSDDALLARLAQDEIPDIASLSALYDRFANALDPFSPARDQAEKVFMEEVAGMYDNFKGNHPGTCITYQIYRRALIVRCKRHLSAKYHPPSV